MWGRALRRFAREKLQQGLPTRNICVRRGSSGVDEVIAKTMASALFLSKSMRHSSAPCCAPELSVRIRHRSFLLGGKRLCGGAGQRSTRGLLSCRRYAGRRRGPTTLWGREVENENEADRFSAYACRNTCRSGLCGEIGR